MRVRRLTVLAAVLASLASPAAALAQSAGDDQYVDPLGGGQTGSGSQGSGSGSQGSGSSGSGSGSAPAPVQSAAPAQATAAPAASAQPTGLARTGIDLRLVAALGAVLLAAGLVLRRGAHGRG
jgi:hypothetical protein